MGPPGVTSEVSLSVVIPGGAGEPARRGAARCWWRVDAARADPSPGSRSGYSWGTPAGTTSAHSTRAGRVLIYTHVNPVVSACINNLKSTCASCRRRHCRCCRAGLLCQRSCLLRNTCPALTGICSPQKRSSLFSPDSCTMTAAALGAASGCGAGSSPGARFRRWQEAAKHPKPRGSGWVPTSRPA